MSENGKDRDLKLEGEASEEQVKIFVFSPSPPQKRIDFVEK